MSKSLAEEVSVHQKVKWNSQSQSIPLTIGLIGHRKLPSQELDGIVAEFDDFLAELLGSFKHTPILLLTSLAEGADRIALHSRFRDSLTICAVFPFEIEDYKSDFQGEHSLKNFEDSLNRVDQYIEAFTLRRRNGCIEFRSSTFRNTLQRGRMDGATVGTPYCRQSYECVCKI